MSNKKMYNCPCCGNLSLEGLPGRFEICDICYWEDDIIQLENPRCEGGANEISLIEAQQNYKKYGVILKKYIDEIK